MNSAFSDQEMTRDADLVDWQAFSLAYYERILRAMRLLRVPEGEIDELAHSFLLKAAEKKYLDSFRVVPGARDPGGSAGAGPDVPVPVASEPRVRCLPEEDHAVARARPGR